jgi:hypothetical protein
MQTGAVAAAATDGEEQAPVPIKDPASAPTPTAAALLPSSSSSSSSSSSARRIERRLDELASLVRSALAQATAAFGTPLRGGWATPGSGGGMQLSTPNPLAADGAEGGQRCPGDVLDGIPAPPLLEEEISLEERRARAWLEERRRGGPGARAGEGVVARQLPFALLRAQLLHQHQQDAQGDAWRRTGLVDPAAAPPDGEDGAVSSSSSSTGGGGDEGGSGSTSTADAGAAAPQRAAKRVRFGTGEPVGTSDVGAAWAALTPTSGGPVSGGAPGRGPPSSSPSPATSSSAADAALLVRVVAQLQDERVQLQARASELELEIDEREELLHELCEALTQARESVGELDEVARLHRRAVERAGELENTNLELAVLARCAAMGGGDGADSRCAMVEDEGAGTASAPFVPLRERALVVLGKRRRREAGVPPAPRQTTVPPVPVKTAAEGRDGVGGGGLDDGEAADDDGAPPDAPSAAAAILAADDVPGHLRACIVELESALATSDLAKELLFAQFKELREKARAAQVALVDAHVRELAQLRGEHARLLARALARALAAEQKAAAGPETVAAAAAATAAAAAAGGGDRG